MKKRYTKKYYFNADKTDYIMISWERGFSNIYIYHNDVRIKALKGSSQILKGLNVTTNGGDIYIRMLTKPFGFAVKSGDRYLFNSRIISQEKLKSVAFQIYAIGITVLIVLFLIFMNSVSNFIAGKTTLLSVITSLIIISSIGLLTGGLFIYLSNKVEKGIITCYFLTLAIISALGGISLNIAFIRLHETIWWNILLFAVVGLILLLLKPIMHIVRLHKHKRALKLIL